MHADVNDKMAETEALLQIGELYRKRRRYDEAHDYYQQARKLAEGQREVGTLKRINCIIGVLLGEQRLPEYFRLLKEGAVAPAAGGREQH